MNMRLRSLFGGALLVLSFLHAITGSALSQEPFSLEGIPEEIQQKKQFLRWWWFFRQRALPLPRIPGGALLRALDRIQEFDPVRLGRDLRGGGGRRWVNIGPRPLENSERRNSLRNAVSGRVADVAVDPEDSRHWLIGAAQGGIWETRDGGDTWEPRTDDMPSLAMGAIAFAPSDPKIVYAGTGEAAFSGDSYFGAGLFKSTDGGTNWQTISPNQFLQTSFSDIKLDPEDAQRLVVATAFGRAGISGSRVSPRPSTGVFWSDNGGGSWTLANPQAAMSGSATDIEVHPSDFLRQFAGIIQANLVPGGPVSSGVHRSSNGGKDWDQVDGPWNDHEVAARDIGRVEMAVSPSNPNVLYVSISHRTNGTLLGMWRTDNAWAGNLSDIAWGRIDTSGTNNGYGPLGDPGSFPGSFCGNQCPYDQELLVDPANPDVLYAGGIPLWKCSPCLTNAQDAQGNPIGLARWEDVSESIHVDQHSMAWVDDSQASPPMTSLGDLPVTFEVNEGQFQESVRFKSRGRGFSVSLKSEGVVVRLRRPQGSPNDVAVRNPGERSPPILEGAPSDAGTTRLETLRIKLEGANSRPRLQGLDQLPGKVSYFWGSDPSGWHRDIATYARVRYEEIYPGVDAVFHGRRGKLEWDFLVAPGADPGVISLALEGIEGESPRLDPSGDLVIPVSQGELRLRQPDIYQEVEGARRTVAGGYRLDSQGRVGFRLGDYDSTRELVIDPVLIYFAYLGAENGDVALDIEVDDFGNAYLTGYTDFVEDALTPKEDAFVVRITPNGEKVDTFILNGGVSDGGKDLDVDSLGNMYVTGWTGGDSFPSETPFSTVPVATPPLSSRTPSSPSSTRKGTSFTPPAFLLPPGVPAEPSPSARAGSPTW